MLASSKYQGELSGQNHLQRIHSLGEAAGHFNLTLDGTLGMVCIGECRLWLTVVFDWFLLAETQRTFQTALENLRQARALRPLPPCDDQVLTGWNGLMISALAKAGVALPEPRYTDAAIKCAKFLKSELYDAENNRLVSYMESPLQ